MAASRMPDAFFARATHHPPPERIADPAGGRPPLDSRSIVRTPWFVPTTGCRWEDVPPEPGRSGRGAHRFPERWEEMGCRDRLHADRLRLPRQADKLDPDLVIVDAVMARALGGGDSTGPSPVDRREKGTKHTRRVDRHGVPRAIRTAGANASDRRRIIPPVLDFPRVTGKPGRPKERPDEWYADRGYDGDATRWVPAWLGIEPHIARRKTPHGSGLGKVRWVAERTIAWFKGLRRMRVRYDRSPVLQDAWNTLAARVIRFRLLHDKDA